VALTSTPQTLFIVPTMLIRQLLFLGFYRLNALLTGGVCWRAFLRIYAKTATAYGVRVQQLVSSF